MRRRDRIREELGGDGWSGWLGIGVLLFALLLGLVFSWARH